MPNKDIEKRKACTRRYEKKHSERLKLRAKRRWIAKKHHPVRQQCSIEGCNTIGERHHPDPDKWKEIVWLCRQHHEQEHHKEERMCGVNGCDNKHHARDYCSKHYLKYYLPILVENKVGRACSLNGCDSKHSAKGYCRKHYVQFSKGKLDITPTPIKEGEEE